MVDTSKCNHQCGIECPNCGHVRVCDCFDEPESVRNNKAEEIASACFKAEHSMIVISTYSLVQNGWVSTTEPELCDTCDEKIGVMFH